MKLLLKSLILALLLTACGPKETPEEHRAKILNENLVIYCQFKIKYGEDYSLWTTEQQLEFQNACKK